MLRVEYHEARYACRLIRGAMTKLKVAIGCRSRCKYPKGEGYLISILPRVRLHPMTSFQPT